MDKLEWCLQKGNTPKRKHRGLRVIEPDVEESREHLIKAEHNIDFMGEVKKLGRFNDWIFPVAFYSMYHSCLAVLVNFGYESRNQECTFVVLKELIKKGRIGLSTDDIITIKNIGKNIDEEDIKTLREDFQYGTKVKAEEQLVDDVCDSAKSFVEKVKGLLHVLWGEV